MFGVYSLDEAQPCNPFYQYKSPSRLSDTTGIMNTLDKHFANSSRLSLDVDEKEKTLICIVPHPVGRLKSGIFTCFYLLSTLIRAWLRWSCGEGRSLFCLRKALEDLEMIVVDDFVATTLRSLLIALIFKLFDVTAVVG
jgi:hypothetical protein